MWFKWVIVGIFSLGALSTVSDIGKQRRPTTPGTAVATVILSGLIIAGAIYFIK